MVKDRRGTRRTKLYSARKACGFTMCQLTALTGVPPSRLSNYERGLGEPRVSTALKLARVFGLTVEQLFSR
jgi:transcriptional regulator with XRE-family HTH domain